MGALKLTACMKVVAKMGEMDQESLLERLDRYTADGVPKDRAQVMAAADTLAELIDERREFMAMLREQHPDLFRVTNAIPEDQDVDPDAPDIKRSAGRSEEEIAAARADGWTISDNDLPSREAAERIVKLRTKGNNVVKPMPAWQEAEVRVVESDNPGLWSIEVRNPGIQRSPARDITDTPEFKRWFGDSKVVDADGKPLVVYHGTNANFSAFDPERLGAATNARTTALGFFSTDNELVANRFADAENGANVMPIYVSIKNPVELGYRTAKERAKAGAKDPFTAMQDAIATVAGKASWAEVTQADVLAWKARLIERGYDGIILRKTIMDGAGGATARTSADPYHDFYIAFYPEQIKSAIGNNGQFDPENADITRSPARSPSSIFGRDIAPVAIKAYKSLSPRAKGIIDGWNVNWSMGQGKLRSSDAFAEVMAAYKPVREKLRQVYGDTIPAYRGEQRDGNESESDRFLFSWTPMREIATSFAVNRRGGMPPEIPQSKVDEQIEAYRKTGIARLNGYKFVRQDPKEWEPDGPDYYHIYWRGEMQTDGDDIAQALQSEKAERDEYIATLREKGKLYTANIPVDSVAFIPVGVNLTQPEFVAEYNPRKDEAQEVKFSPARAQEDTPEFKAWFNGSQVVDDDGRPKVVYHSTNAMQWGSTDLGFSEFLTDTSEMGAHFGTIEQANSFGNAERRRIMPAYLSIKNPLRLEDRGGFDPRFVVDQLLDMGITPKDGSGFAADPDIPQLQRAIEDAGYDGIVYLNRREGFDPFGPDGVSGDELNEMTDREVIDMFGDDAQDSWIAFRPEQIKSATGNRGTFDPADADITRSPARQTETPEFKAWFGDSKVVDDEGRPMVVYHGTVVRPDTGRVKSMGDIQAFDRMFTTQFRRPSLDTVGSWFSTNPGDGGAEMYSGRGQGSAIYPVYLSIQNPQVTTFQLMQRRARLLANGKDDGRQIGAEEVDAYRKWLQDTGKDGIKIEGSGNDGSTEFDNQVAWIALEPKQIKSATGNRGTFDPNDADITRSPGRTATGAAWDSPSVEKFDDLVYKLQDKNIDTKRVVEAIQAAGGAIADDLNVYLQEELYHGRAAKRTEDFVNMELNPLVEQLAKDGLKLEDLEEFLHARHAKEANEVIAQRNPGVQDLQDGGSGMKTGDAQQYLASLPADLRQKLESAAAKVDAILKKTRELYVDYELESRDTVDAWGKMFQHYIPLMREDKDGNGSPGLGQGFSVKGRETKGRTGSTRKVVDIMANIAMQRERAIVRGEKNRVSQALVGLATANPNEGFWKVDEVPTERVFNEKTGLVEDRVDPLYKSRPNAVIAKIKGANGQVKEHAVLFNEEDPRALRMAEALKNLDANQIEGLLGVSAQITRYFAAVNTQYNPVFGVVNLVRDVQGALLNLTSTPLAGDQTKIAKYTMSALRGIYGDAREARKGNSPSSQWANLWDEFQEVGGQTGYRDLFKTSADRAEAIKKTLNPDAWADSKLGKIFTANGALKVPMAQAKRTAGWLFDWLSDYNLAMENGVRLAAYKAGLERGMSKEQAASAAKNLTVNFNRKGQVSQQAGAMYAFFNASLQGTARIAQTLFDMQPGKPKTIRLSSTGKKIVYGGMLLGVTQALALAAAGFNDEDPPEFARERSLIIPVGGKKYITIPMPLGFHVLPSIGRVATEFTLSGFKNPHERALQLASLFADTFNPIGNAGLSMQTLAPTALDPLVALTENKDWTGKPIARESSNKAIPGHALGRDTATSLAKMLSEGINTLSGGNKYTAGVLSPTPDQIDYLLGQVTGGVGRELSKVEQTVLSTARGEDLPTYKIPLVGRFVGDAKSQASEGTAFYANTERLNKLETEIKGLQKDGKNAEAAELRRNNSEAYLITMANQAERQIQKLRSEKRELIKANAPREQVKAVEDRITAVMARLNRAAESLREKQNS